MVRRSACLVLALVVVAGCESSRPRSEARASYPIERPPPPTDIDTKDSNPGSEVWPLDLWLVEFEKRNGVDIHFRDQDTVNRTVIHPGPGPFDSDEQALAVLRQIARRNGLYVAEEKRHVYALKRWNPGN